VFILRLEAIGDDSRQWLRLQKARIAGTLGDVVADAVVGNTPSRAWVARIVGEDRKFGFAREFLKSKKDYSESNECGSRGVKQIYFLEDGLYEVMAPVSWTRSDRYLCKVEGGVLSRLTKEEMVGCLRKKG
jgi:hypothetical protein